MEKIYNFISKIFKRKKTQIINVFSEKSELLKQAAKNDIDAVFQSLQTSPDGLSKQEADNRLKKYGFNIIAREKQKNPVIQLLSRFKDPLSLLMLTLVFISLLMRDFEAAIIITIIILVSVFLGFFQEYRSSKAAQKLQEMVHTTATVIRRSGSKSEEHEVPLKLLTPGDIIHLSVGDMIPADARLISAKDLFVSQSVLTGESMPIEKFPEQQDADVKSPLDLLNICFMGSNVISGTATAVIILTGESTFLGSLAKKVAGQRELTSFDKGVNQFTWLMIHYMLIMAPLVFLINGLTKGNWIEAFLFAVSIAVGLTPEMLPMIVTVNLAKGALSMSKHKVIVKRLNSIQNFGAMDVLCADKTGTITQDRIILEKHVNLYGQEDKKVLNFAYINSLYQTGLKNLLDREIINYKDMDKSAVEKEFKKIDEIPFDFERRRMSVIVENSKGQHILICKGAVREIFDASTKGESDNQSFNLDKSHLERLEEYVNDLNEDGFRVIAVAYRQISISQKAYSIKDESDMTMIGYIAFLDPPKETSAQAIKILNERGVNVKILTGDNELVTGKICRDVNLESDRIILGSEIDSKTDAQLAEDIENVNIFAKLTPSHKERIIKILHSKNHVVGFLGDGINDAPALKAADVGISVDTAADIAKESADIILLEKSLLILGDGVIAGRRVFGNIIKYIRMGASSNFGNMFSVVGASAFLPFLPMAPIQILVNNLLYDISQTAIPTDQVDEEYLTRPRKWEIKDIGKFIGLIGPVSSIFDYITYFIMIFIFGAWTNPALFHTGWFVESLASQTLIIHIIRTNKIPFIQSHASIPLIITTILIIITGILLPFSPLANALGFVKLPPFYWPLLSLTLFSYVALTYKLKSLYIKKHWIS